MKNKTIKLLKISIFLFMSNGLFAAGLRITVEKPIKKLIECNSSSNYCYDQAAPRLTNLQPGQEYKIDNGLNGFDDIFFEFVETGGVGATVRSRLNIAGLTGWRDLRINADGSVYIGPWGFEKERTVPPVQMMRWERH